VSRFPSPLPTPPERKAPEPKPREVQNLEVKGGTSAVYTVQVGAFRDKRQAEVLRQRLHQRGYSAQVMLSGTRTARFYRVRLGEFTTPAQAKRLVGQLKSRMGLDAMVAAAN
jgi:cell division protein FtsN